MKTTALIICSFLVLLAGQAHAFESICEKEAGAPYCGSVGKTAYNASGASALRKVILGPIAGAAWRPKGSLITRPGVTVRTAQRDGHYFIIGPGGVDTQPFLRDVREIKAR